MRARTAGAGGLFPIAIQPLTAGDPPQALAVAFRALEPPHEAYGHAVALRACADTRGRRRLRLVCPDCQRASDALCLTVGVPRLTCRRCARLSYHPATPAPRPRGSDEWAETAGRELAELRREATAVRQRHAPASNYRPHPGSSRDGPDTLHPRQRAVAHLWGCGGWSLAQLATLFGTSERTIKRDLRAARAAGAVPPRSRVSVSYLIAQTKSLLGRCRKLGQTLQLAAAGPRTGGGHVVGMLELQARLLREERRLVDLLVELQEGPRAGTSRGPALPASVDPELIEFAGKLARRE